MVSYKPSNSRQKRSLLRRLLGRIKRLFSRNRAPSRNVKSITDGAQRGWKLKKISHNALVLGGIISGCVGAGWILYHLVINSDIFRLTDMTVFGNHFITDQQVFDLGDISLGTSILGVDRKKTVAAIAGHPWIDSAQVEVHWPSSIEILIREHRPLALVNLQNGNKRQLFYIDREGEIFTPVEGGQDIDYPVINGHLGKSGSNGDTFADNSLAQRAFALLKIADKGNAILPIQAISEINIDPERGIVVYLADKPFPIFFGTDRVQTKYYQLVKILDRLYRKDGIQDIKEIRMDYAYNKVLVSTEGN